MGKKKRRNKPCQVVLEHATGVEEASGVAPLNDGSFLIVDDERGVFVFEPGEKAEPADGAGRDWADLEGVCASEDAAWILAERDGGVWRFARDGKLLRDGERIGALPKIGQRKNGGWEGLDYVAPGGLADGARLLAVHQEKPRQVVVVDPHSLAIERSARIPKDARKALGDLNDIAFDTKTKEVLVLSGKSGRLARLRWHDDELVLVAVHRVDTSKKDVPEGLAFDAEGRLWLVTDGEGWLRQIRLG